MFITVGYDEQSNPEFALEQKQMRLTVYEAFKDIGIYKRTGRMTPRLAEAVAMIREHISEFSTQLAQLTQDNLKAELQQDEQLGEENSGVEIEEGAGHTEVKDEVILNFLKRYAK